MAAAEDLLRATADSPKRPQLAKLFRIIRNQTLHAHTRECRHLTEVVDGPDVDIEPVIPSSAQPTPRCQFLLHMNRASAELLGNGKWIAVAVDAVNHAQSGFWSEFPQARQAPVIEGREDRSLQIVVVTQDKQRLEFEAGRRSSEGFQFQTDIRVMRDGFQGFFQSEDALAL